MIKLECLYFSRGGLAMPIIYKSVLLISDIPLINIAFLSINVAFKLHKCLLRYITTHELLYIGGATCLSSLLFFLYGNVTDVIFPLSVYFIYTSLVLLLLILSRFSYKFVNRILSKFSKSYNALKPSQEVKVS